VQFNTSLSPAVDSSHITLAGFPSFLYTISNHFFILCLLTVRKDKATIIIFMRSVTSQINVIFLTAVI